MSEKQLRKASKKLWYACTTQSQTAVEAMLAVDKAVAEPPDVVKVLRWLKEYSKRLAEGCKKYPISSEKRLAMEITRGAIDAVFEWASKQFHVRLIADGWEWTEEVTE